MKASKLIAADFLNDLTSPYARRWFCIGFASVIVIAFGGIWILGGGVRETIISVLGNIIAGCAIILSSFYLYYYFIGFPSNQVSVVRPQDIGSKLREISDGVSTYMFWGRAGSYFRARPLIEIDRYAQEKKSVAQIYVLLPDPDETRLVEAYKEIRKSLGEIPEENPLLTNVLATTIACAVVSANNKFVQAKVYYSKFLPAFRVDLSDRGAMLTQDDPAKAAIFFNSDSEFFQMFKTTVHTEIGISREVDLQPQLFKGRTLDSSAVDKVTLNCFGLKIKKISDLQERVAMLITEKKHRYQ